MTAYESAVTVTVTTAPPQETATAQTTSVVLASSPLKKRQSENTVPAYMSPKCSDAAQYSSACSCWSVSASTVTASVAAVTSTTAIALTVTQYDYESPPLSSSPVSFPADDSWTKTYTYSEYQLPVFTSAPDPSIVVDYPTPSETCLMDAVPTGDSFVSRTTGVLVSASF